MLTSLSTQIILKGMQPLEPFRGTDDQDVSSWLTDLEELFEAAKQKPEERLNIDPTYLAGDAKQWYRVRGPYETWSEFKTALTKAFTSSAHQLKTSSLLYNRRQASTESVQTYYFDVMRLCTRLNPDMPADERLLHLLRGLKPSIAQTIIMFNPRDCSELLEHGKRAEAAAYTAQITNSSMEPDDIVPNDISAAIGSRSDRPVSSYPSSSPSSNYNAPSSSNTQRQPQSFTAFRSRPSQRSSPQTQHNNTYPDSFPAGQQSDTNPPRQHRRQRNVPTASNFTCYTCGGYGHRARDCPTPRDHLNF